MNNNNTKKKNKKTGAPTGTAPPAATGSATLGRVRDAPIPKDWALTKGQLFETKLFSLATQTVTSEVFLVEISEFGLSIRHQQNGLVMRAFPIRGIQRFLFLPF
jgi:hypothetical protein